MYAIMEKAMVVANLTNVKYPYGIWNRHNNNSTTIMPKIVFCRLLFIFFYFLRHSTVSLTYIVIDGVAVIVNTFFAITLREFLP